MDAAERARATLVVRGNHITGLLLTPLDGEEQGRGDPSGKWCCAAISSRICFKFCLRWPQYLCRRARHHQLQRHLNEIHAQPSCFSSSRGGAFRRQEGHHQPGGSQPSGHLQPSSLDCLGPNFDGADDHHRSWVDARTQHARGSTRKAGPVWPAKSTKRSGLL